LTIDADARNMAKILAEAAELLDLSQPTAVMLSRCCTASRIPTTRISWSRT
jgi:hypothetical protein